MCFFDIIVCFHISMAIYMLMTLDFYIFLENLLNFRPIIELDDSHHKLNMSKGELSGTTTPTPTSDSALFYSPISTTFDWLFLLPLLRKRYPFIFLPLVIFCIHLFTLTLTLSWFRSYPQEPQNIPQNPGKLYSQHQIHPHPHASRFFPQNQSYLVTLLHKTIYGE